MLECTAWSTFGIVVLYHAMCVLLPQLQLLDGRRFSFSWQNDVLFWQAVVTVTCQRYTNSTCYWHDTNSTCYWHDTNATCYWHVSAIQMLLATDMIQMLLAADMSALYKWYLLLTWYKCYLLLTWQRYTNGTCYWYVTSIQSPPSDSSRSKSGCVGAVCEDLVSM
jgi:hypothetical protein